MDKKDIRTLNFLEEIDNAQTPSQRDLSKKLDVSLGLVNSFIRRLAQKGYLKITTVPRNRVKYILTPKGAAEKTRLTYQYFQYSFEFYRRARKTLQNLFKNLAEQGVKRVVLYGVTDLAEIAYISLHETPIKMGGMVDEKKIGKKFFGIEIISPDMLDSLSFDRIIITSINEDDTDMEKILRKGISRNKIIVLE